MHLRSWAGQRNISGVRFPEPLVIFSAQWKVNGTVSFFFGCILFIYFCFVIIVYFNYLNGSKTACKELAVSCKTSSARPMHFVPTWAPIWFLSGVGVMAGLTSSFPQVTMPSVTCPSHATLFMSWFWFELQPAWQCILLSLPMAGFCFHKLDGHKKMLDQMATFELSEAKCTLETDRVVLGRQVVELFQEDGKEDTSGSLRSSHDFNGYVRGPLRNSVLDSMGREVHLPLTLCAALNVPVVLLGAVMTLSCNRHADCETFVLLQGYTSVAHYMATCAAVNCIIVPMLSALLFPLALQIIYLVRSQVTGKVLRTILGAMGATVVILSVNVLQAAGGAATVVIICKPSPTWLFAYAASSLLLWLLARYLFGTRSFSATA